MPPKQLPGFYYDEAKNRYFPLSSRTSHSKTPGANPRPTNKIPQVESSPEQEVIYSTKRRRLACSNYRDKLLHVTSSCTRDTLRHELEASMLASTSGQDHAVVPLIGRITNFVMAPASTEGGQAHYLIGDSNGWIYRATSLQASDVSGEPPPSLQSMNWTMEFNLNPSTEISSMSISGPRCIATSAGSTAKIAVLNLDSPSSHSTIFSIKGLHEIWDSHLSGKSLVIGSERRAVYLEDIEVGPPLRFLETQSDVLAVHSSDTLVYAGSRNGAITRFDLRSDKPDTLKLFHGPSHSSSSSRNTKGNGNGGDAHNQTSSIIHLDLVRQWQLLTSSLNGHLATYDLRFLSEKRPIHIFNGHVNSLSRRLGITVDPTHDFLFAAGEDNIIRAWSLQTGQPIHQHIPNSTTSHLDAQHPRSHKKSLFSTTFPCRISSMHVATQDDGLCLYAADAADTVYKFFLGRQTHLHAL